MTLRRLILIAIIIPFSCYANTHTFIAKIELPIRVLQHPTFTTRTLITQNITCSRRIPWNHTRTTHNQELWILTLPSTQNKEALLTYLRQKSFIKNIEPMMIGIGQSEESNPDTHKTPYYINTESLSAFHKLGKEKVIVAMLDSGVDRHHPNLSTQMYINTQEPINGIDDDNNGYIDDRFGYDFTDNSPTNGDPIDNNGHGTHLAGIIAAKKIPGIAIQGISKNSIIMNLKCLDKYKQGSQIDIATAIRYAVDNGAKIINCSWAITQPSWILQDAINYAINHNVFIVAAAGNHNQTGNIYPSAYSHVLGISSVNQSNRLSNIANTSLSFDYATYGENIISTYPNNTYKSQSGTSQSTAFMCGLLANVISIAPTIKQDELKTLLIESSIEKTENEITYKTINIDLLLQKTAAYFPQHILQKHSDTLESSCNVWPNPSQNQDIHFKCTLPSVPQGDPIQINIYNEFGIKQKSIHTTYLPEDVITWNGKNNSGATLRNGSYFYIIFSKIPYKPLTKGTLSIIKN